MSLHPCASCRRHVAALDPACPFCGAAQRAHPQPIGVPVAGRMSRAAVFVGLSACWSNAAPTEKTIVADDKSHAIATDARPAPPTGASLYGVVSDGVAALPHAMVELRDANGRIAATNTDERGAYRLEGIVAGDYQIIVQYGGGDEVGSTQQPVTVRDVGSQLDLTLKVHRRVPAAKPYGAPPARRRTV